LRKESLFCVPEALKLLKQKSVNGRNGEREERGAFAGRTGVWDTKEMKNVEFEWQPFWGEDVPFSRVRDCFEGAEKIVVRCLICDRFIFPEQGMEQEILGGVLGREMTMGQAVRWVEEGLKEKWSSDAGREVSILVRMRLVATAGDRWGGRSRWAEIGVSVRSLLWY
jgi:hypothetical protein